MLSGHTIKYKYDIIIQKIKIKSPRLGNALKRKLSQDNGIVRLSQAPGSMSEEGSIAGFYFICKISWYAL